MEYGYEIQYMGHKQFVQGKFTRAILWDGMDGIGLPQDEDGWRAIVNAVIHHLVSKIAWKLWSGYKINGLLSSAQFRRVSQNSATSFFELLTNYQSIWRMPEGHSS